MEKLKKYYSSYFKENNSGKDIILLLVYYLEIFSVSYLILWAVLGDGALPKGLGFTYYIIFIGSFIGGKIATLCKIPALLGMLIAGIIIRNSNSTIGEGLDQRYSSVFQYSALAIILLRAGLGLDLTLLKKLGYNILLLAFSPCLAEAITVAILSKFLIGFDWTWAFILGFIVGAVSPAVVVPMLLSLKQEGYGEDKGVATLVIAAASFDDVLAITGFSVLLGIAFSEGSLALNILQGPIDIIGGLGGGTIISYLILYPLRSKSISNSSKFCILFFIGLLCTIGGQRINFLGAGALATITVGIFAARFWKDLEPLPEHDKDVEMITQEPSTDKDQKEEVTVDGHGSSDFFASKWMEILWRYAQPVLFGIVGSTLDLSIVFNDIELVGYAVLTLFISIIIRCTVCFIAISKTNLNFTEKLFVTFAWLPKATVQASIGAVPLYYARDMTDKNDEYELWGEKVLTIAVLSILLSAPLGALMIKIFGPRWLSKKT